MHKIALQIVSAFIPNKEKRKAFRKKHKEVDTNTLLNILLETNDNLACLKTDLSNSLTNITSDLNNLQNEITNLKRSNTNTNNILFDLYLDNLIQKRKDSPFILSNYLNNITKQPEYLCVDSNQNYLNI